MITVIDKEVQVAFETVCQMSSEARAAWFEKHETVASVRHEVEELLRYDALAEEEAFFAPRLPIIQSDSLLGSQVGPYEVVSMIGRGGMGSVYLARRSVPYEQAVALKVADLRLGSGAARFDEERQVLADLHHPGIARLLDGGILPDDRPYLVMEYVPGEHIDAFAEKHKLRVMERVQLWLKVCEAVASAHERGIIHRDLKPSNILVTPERRVVVVDFGLARRWEQDSGLTRTATILGTPEYMAPEQAAGRKLQTTPSTDVYALGAVLYTLLTGRPPFRAESPLQLVAIMLQDDPVPPRRLNPAVPRDLQTICMKCLEKNANDRYPSAKELWDEGQRLLKGQPIHARPTSLWKQSWLWAKRRPGVAMMGILLLITSITSLVTIGFYWRKADYSLETAKLATVQLFEHASKLTNEPGMQKAQLDLLSKAIRAYDPLVKVLNEEKITLQHLQARRLLIERAIALGERENEELQAEELLKDSEAFVKAFPSSDAELEWAFALRRMGAVETNRSDSLNRRKHLQASLDYHQQAEAILKRLSARHPERDGLLGIHGEMLSRVADAEKALGLEDASVAHLVQAHDIFKHLYEKYPEDPQAPIRYCQALFFYADNIQFQADKNKLYGELLENAYQLDCVCQSKWPERHDYRAITTVGVFRLARWLERIGDWERARNLYSNQIALYEKLMEKYPDVTDYVNMLSETLYWHGNVCYAQGRMAEAQQSYTRSFALGEMVTPTLAGSAMNLSKKLLSCPIHSLRDVDRVQALLSKFQNKTGNDPYQLCLGRLRLRQNRLAEAKEAFTKALELKGWRTEVTEYQLYLALVHAKLGEANQATDFLQQTKAYFQRYPKDINLGYLRDEVEATLKK